MTVSSPLRRTAAVLAAAVIAVAGLALPAAAKGPKAHKAHAHQTHGKSAAAKARAAEKKAAAHARRDAKKAAKAASYVATGTVLAVSGDMLVVDVHGGNRKALRGSVQLFTLAEGAKVSRDDVAVTLAEVLPGDHVAVKGSRDGDTLWATKVSASSPEVDDATDDEVIDDTTEDTTDNTGDENVVDPDPTVTDPTNEGDPAADGGDQTDGDPLDATTP